MINININKTNKLTEVAYPPPPWYLGGNSWVGVFKSPIGAGIPIPLKPLINSQYLVVALIRYLHGSLTYDELIIGSMARYKWRIGLFVHHIWVDDMSSLWGGRRIWGLNKEMAEFSWKEDTVEITDEHGQIASITVDQQKSSLPAIKLPVPSFGQIGGDWVFTLGSIKTHLARTGMQINQWSERFPYQINGQPLYSIAGKPFDMTFVKPNYL